MKSVAAARSRARQFLVQALYQALITGDQIGDVVHPFIAYHNMKRADVDYFREVLMGIHTDRQELESLISERLDATFDRAWEEVDPVEKGILLLGCYELRSRIDVPYKVVINEAVTLAKSFGATDSYKYVNSIMDSVAKSLRTAELT